MTLEKGAGGAGLCAAPACTGEEALLVEKNFRVVKSLCTRAKTSLLRTREGRAGVVYTFGEAPVKELCGHSLALYHGLQL